MSVQIKRGTNVASPYAVAWAILVVLVATWAVIVLISHYSAADVRAACAQHSGVAQVVDDTWSGGPGRATVVCRDGYVGSL